MRLYFSGHDHGHRSGARRKTRMEKVEFATERVQRKIVTTVVR